MKWYDFEQGGARDVPLKTRGHEKVRVSAWLIVKEDGTKLKPFIVFAGGKPDSKSLHEEFKSQSSVASRTNGWMNENLTMRWINEIVGRFVFSKSLLAPDSFESHLTDPVKILLKK